MPVPISHGASEISNGDELVNSYKVLISKLAAEHAGEPDNDGRFRVFTKSLRVIGPGDVCTHSYFVIGNCKTKGEAEHINAYLKTSFVRFLVMLAMSSINLSKHVFPFVPLQDFTSMSDIDWSRPVPEIDAQLYAKYGITKTEQKFIESMIKPME